jgi:hypothetical protein
MRVILSIIVCLLTLRFRTRRSLELEVIALRHQLGVLQRTKRHPTLITPADRFIWGWFYQFCPQSVRWLRIAKPSTVIKWHRHGFLFYWRYKCKRGSLPRKVKGALRRLIFQMYSENAGWGAGRIHGELQKLGYNITKRTVANYLKRIPHSRPTPGWRTFLKNHMHDAAAIDMFVVISMSFKIIFAFIVLGLDRRKILHVGATEHPTQNWLASEITEAFTKNPRPNYLIRDRDRCYGRKFSERVNELGVREHVTAKQSPWQNIYAERVIWTIRRECLDHVIIMSENHLRRILVAYADYYNRSRTHFSLDQDCPTRPVQPLGAGSKIVSIPQVGGLHHRYERSPMSTVCPSGVWFTPESGH